jgi:small subunit ribosomal protein S11
MIITYAKQSLPGEPMNKQFTEPADEQLKKSAIYKEPSTAKLPTNISPNQKFPVSPVPVNQRPVLVNRKPVPVNQRPVPVDKKPVPINQRPAPINQRRPGESQRGSVPFVSSGRPFQKGNTALAARVPKNKNLFCLISIKRTKNNTHTTISNLFGGSKTRWSISAGQLKLPGGRRKTRLSQRLIYKSCLEKAISFGYKFAAIHCKGTRGSKVRIFRSFGPSLGVLLIKDTTSAAHNGCRPRKVRRV